MSITELARRSGKITLTDGFYSEKVFIRRDSLEIRGSDNTVISFGDCAEKRFPDGEKYGTFRSYTAYFGCKRLLAENLTIENTAGDGSIAGQAVAAYIDCREGGFRNIRFIGRQDTVFLAPLPPEPVIPGSFRGPNEELPREKSLLYFENCYFEGSVDFIFGGAAAVFENCVVNCVRPANGSDGYLCAPSTDKEQPFGFVFLNCTIGGSCTGSFFLARPWRAYAKAAFIGCTYDNSIKPEGWDCWGKESNKETARFCESKTDTSARRASWGIALGTTEERAFLDFARSAKKRVFESCADDD